MSVVAVKKYRDRIEIAADSIVINGWTQDKKMSKLFKVNELVVGGCGTALEISLLSLFLKTHSPKSSSLDDLLELVGEFRGHYREQTGNEIGNSYLWVVGGKVFYSEGMYVSERKDFYAIGAGRDFALSALYLGHTPKEAVAIACELSTHCEKPVKQIVVKR